MVRPKAILFDFGGTLDSDGLPWKERFHALYRREGIAIEADAFAPLFYAADDRLVTDLPRTAGLQATIDQLTRNLDPLLPTGSAARRQRVAARFSDEAEACFARNRPILMALAKRFTLGIVSNFYGNLPAVCHEAGLDPFFDVVIDSTIVGASKPESAIFRAALDAIEADASECIFVGDSLRRDWAGAKRLGMPFVWIEHPSMTVSGPERPEHRAPSLAELPAALGIFDDAA